MAMIRSSIKTLERVYKHYYFIIRGEETIEATFGDSLPTLVDQIRKVR